MTRQLPVLLIALLAMAGCQPGNPEGNTGPGHIEVSGHGEVQVTPDVFPVQAEFVRVGKDVPGMKAELDQKVADLLDTLERLEVDEKDIRASDLQVRPEWQWQPERRLIGQRVSRTVVVRLRGLERYISVLSELGRAAPDQLQPLGSELADPAAAEEQALTLALRDARSRASALAREAGRELGSVVFIKEQGGSSPQPVALMAMEAAPARQAYTAGEQTISANLVARFELR